MTGRKIYFDSPEIEDPLPDQFWLSFGVVAGAALAGPRQALAMEHLVILYRILTERYPEMAALKKYLPKEG